MIFRFLLFVWLLAGLSIRAQPNWTQVKSTTTVQVAIPTEFGTPVQQSLSTGGWEDGMFISRDGLHLYCIYIPIDGLSWTLNSGNNCSFSAYSRGPTFGIDLVTNPIGCSEWLNPDILISSRSNTLMAFPTWSLSNLSGPVFGQGAPQYVMSSSSTADIFVYTDNQRPPYKTDLYYIRNCSLNPALASGTIFPAPITTDSIEDNPHVERLSSMQLVLFFDSPNFAVASGGLDIWYSVSNDDGSTWGAPQPVSSVNTALNEHQPHLYKDNLNQWWLYFTGTDAAGKYSIYRAPQTTPNNWNSWGTRQLVVGSGNSAGIGEATLTQNGDLSFVVVYDANGAGATSTDRFDCDPWFLPHVTTTGIADAEQDAFSLFPNPVKDILHVNLKGTGHTGVRVSLLSALGEEISQYFPSVNTFDMQRNQLPAGIYFIRLDVPGKASRIFKVVFSDL
ncbi:MAG: T9SS type A sorting domain-containing protein [Bacteroidetes bacterium]|nr:T9SS type A sorting domain-containing protein [Bacteroidota bacterium]